MNVLGMPNVLGWPVGVGGSAPATTFEQDITAADFTLWHKLQETSGDVMIDSSGNGLDGTYSAAAAHPTLNDTTCMGLPAPTFDGGDNALIDYADLNALFNTNTGTLMAMIRHTDWDSAGVRRVVTIGADANNYLSINKSAANSLRSFASIGGLAAQTLVTVSNAYNNLWIPVFMTYDRAGNSLKIFTPIADHSATGINGTWAGTLTQDFCQVGSRLGGQFWLGALGHVGYIASILSDAKINSLIDKAIAEGQAAGESWAS